MPVAEFRRMESITPSGEAACVKLEQAIHDAINEAEDDGLCFGMIVSCLHHSAWWMHQRMQDED